MTFEIHHSAYRGRLCVPNYITASWDGQRFQQCYPADKFTKVIPDVIEQLFFVQGFIIRFQKIPPNIGTEEKKVYRISSW